MTQNPAADESARQRRQQLQRLIHERFGKLDLFPATEGQKRLWLSRELHPHPAAFNLPMAFRLNPRPEIALLERSLQTLVDRHPILRTSYVLLGGELRQLVQQRAPLELPQVDACGWSEERLHNELADWGAKPFDLQKRGPQMRAAIFRRERDAVLLLCWHHIGFDAWSFAVMADEIASCYACLQRGSEFTPYAAAPYAEFAAEQKTYVQSEQGQADAAYWRTIVNAETPRLRLPGERSLVPGEPQLGAGEARFRLSEAEFAAIRDVAEQCGVTTFAFLLAAFHVLLHRHTGQTRTALQYPLTGRGSTRFARTVGYVVNIALSVADVRPDGSFSELLAEVAGQLRRAAEHQAFPVSRLVAELGGEGSLDRFSGVYFTYLKSAERAAHTEPGGLLGQPIDVERRGVGFTIEAQLFDEGATVSGVFVFDRSRIEPAAVENLVARYQTLLRQLAEAPGRRIEDADICTEAERQVQLEKWNRAGRAFPPRLLHELVSEQAERTPRAVAVRHESGALSYAQLMDRSGRVATWLQQRGVGPDTPVALCLPRTADAIVWILGVLRAGGAYVPIDPEYPRARVAEILDAVRPAVVASVERWRAKLGEGRPELVAIDSVDLVRTLKRTRPLRDPGVAVEPSNLSYILFTSGSTGRPKGIALEHRSGSILVQWAREKLSRQDLDCVLASTAFTFDLSVFEIFAPLACGGSLALVENLLELPGSKLARGVSLINTTPSLMQAFVNSHTVPDSVDVVILCGEYLRPSLVDQIYANNGSIDRVYDLYGPAEDTTYSTCALRRPGEPPNIGRPIVQTQAYVLDEKLRPAPIGLPGELYLSGAGLARGYWRQPRLTGERFIANPFSAEPGARMYRTGDRCQYLPNGRLVFLGRNDHQVKLRGMRIELGEIEKAVCSHDGVKEAVAMVFESPDAAQVLTCFFTSDRSPVPTAQDLTRHLAARLPRGMAPARFVALEAFPRNFNGKADRKALAAMAPPDDVEPRSTRVAPRTALEAKLLDIWREVLGDREIGVEDDFFELGGDSLGAVQVSAGVSRTLNAELPASAVLETPTIAELAARLNQESASPGWKSLVSLQPRGSRPPLFCFHACSGQVLMYRDLAKRLGEDQPLYGLQSIGLSSRDEPLEDVESMVTAYLAEIRSLQPEGPYYLAGFCMGAYVALECARRLEADGQQVAFLASITADGEWRTALGEQGGLNYHWRNLARLRNAGERAYYVVARLYYRVSRFLFPTLNRLMALWTRSTRRHSDTARRLAVDEINRRANIAFRPKPYSGKVVFFQGRVESFRDPLAFWGPMARAGVEVIVVEGQEITALQEPNVDGLARELSRKLNETVRDSEPAATPVTTPLVSAASSS